MDDLNRAWPGRAEFFRSFGGELDQEMVDQFDAAHTEDVTQIEASLGMPSAGPVIGRGQFEEPQRRRPRKTQEAARG